jgi:hypothetical protein
LAPYSDVIAALIFLPFLVKGIGELLRVAALDVVNQAIGRGKYPAAQFAA